MKFWNVPLPERIRLAVELLEKEGKLSSPLAERVDWFTDPKEALKEGRVTPRAFLSLGVLGPLFEGETGPMVLELLRQENFEIEVFRQEVSGTPRHYETFVFTKHGPLRRLYRLEGDERAPKKKKAPDHEVVVNVVELLVRMDSPIDFQQRLWSFLDQATRHILQKSSRH